MTTTLPYQTDAEAAVLRDVWTRFLVARREAELALAVALAARGQPTARVVDVTPDGLRCDGVTDGGADG